METFVSNIKKIYRDRAINYDEEHWPPNHSGKLMRLELVAKKKGEHFFALSRQQSISDKSFKQALVAYGDLFKSGKKEVRKVLVEGSAGIGKTSLCISISKDWANGELFQEYKLLLLLPLHQEKIALASSLSKLLENFMLQNTPSIVNHLEESRGEGVLMIADGWDKLGESERREGSFIHNLLFGDTLSLASVLVTSRPTASVPQHRDTCIDRFVEVHGFKKRSLEDYVQSEVQEGASSRLILEQLDYNPLLESMGKVPFICTVICHSLWHTFSKTLPPTMTELSTKVILNVMCNYVWKRGTSNSLSDVDSLPESLLDSWWCLCQLAFEMLTASKNQIDLSRIKSDIGLLEIIMERNSVFFHFLHPMFQEYLAALHIVKQPHASQLKSLDAIKSQKFTMFWQYFFGICMEYDQKSIIKHAIHILSTSDLFKSLLCQCAFEARNDVITTEIVKALTLSSEKKSIHFGDPNTAHACTAVLYVIDSIRDLVCGMEINFSDCNLDSKVIGKLADILAKRQDQLQVRSLDLSDNGLSDDNVANLFRRALSSFQSLEKLFLRNNKISGEGITAIMTALSKSSSRSVLTLDLSFNPLTLTDLCALQNAIKSNTFSNLEILFMQGSLTTDANVNIEYFITFADALLSHCQYLRRLDISSNDLGDSVTPVLSRVISKLLIGFNQNFDLCMNREYMSEVDKKFVAIMQDCVRRKGTIDHTVAHGVIVGPGRSGKNSLMNRLMGEGPPDPKIISPSTGVLESVVKVEVKKMCTVAAAVNNLLWKRLDYDEEALELMMTTAKSHTAPIEILESTTDIDDNQKAVKSAVVVVKKTSTSAPPALPPRPEPSEIINIAKGSVVPIESDHEKGRHKSVPHSSNVLKQEGPLDIFKRAVKLRRMDALREHLESSWSLYLTNTGGQMEFQELLPLIVCGPSVFFITFPLDKNLHEHYIVQYQYTDGSEKTYPSPSTLMDEILQTLATIAALDCTGPQHKINLKPKVFFVGTHKDQIPESSTDETIKKIDKQLQEKVKQTSLYHQGSIQFAVGTEQLMFAVNNLDKSDTDFQKIRSALQQTIERSKEFTVECPSTWLIFSLVLRAKHKSSQILSYNECFAIAQGCGISDRTELNNALFFIHTRLGLVRYFCVEDLNTLVVIDPQILFDTITKLIVETFIGDHAEVNEIEEFQKRGIFSMEVMERISEKSHSDAQLPFKWLLKLLNHLRIVAFFTDHKGDQKCFFPSALCHAPEQQPVECTICPIKPPPPLLLAFKSGFCPRGIPGALIKYLMTNEMQSQISWELCSSRVFRNQVSFGVGPCDIVLTIQPTHLEVSFDPESDAVDESEVKETCEETFIQLQQAMKDVTKGYRECDYFFTFNCTRPECKCRPHPAEMDWATKKLKCKITDRRSRLPGDYQVWMPQKKSYQPQQGGLSHDQTLNLVLDADGIPKHLGQIADSMYEWEGPVAEQLGLTSTDVAAINRKYPGELRLQTRAALEKWKQKLGSNATYNNLIGVFEQAGYQENADAIRKLILQSSVDKTENSADKLNKFFPTLPDRASLPPLPQLPVFPEPELISSSSSIALPSVTAVLIEEEYQELQGQAVEESVYLKTEQVLEPVDEPLVSQLSSDEDDTTEQHGITDPRNELSSKQPEADVYDNASKQQGYADVSDEISISSPHEFSQDPQADSSHHAVHKESSKAPHSNMLADSTQPNASDPEESMSFRQMTPDSQAGGTESHKLQDLHGQVQHKSDGINNEAQSGEGVSCIQPQSDLEICTKNSLDGEIQEVDRTNHPNGLLQNELSPQSISANDNNRSATEEDYKEVHHAVGGEGSTAIVYSNDGQISNRPPKQYIATEKQFPTSLYQPDDHYQSQDTSFESSKTEEDKITSADTVDQLQPNIMTSGDSTTGGSIQSNPGQQNTPSAMDGKEGSGCIFIALYNYEAQTKEDLTFLKGEALQIISREHADWWYARSLMTNKKGFVPNNYVQTQEFEWFFGKTTRAEAEKLLSRYGYPPGTFLIRENECQHGQYALTVRDRNGRIWHYQIMKVDAGGGWYIDPQCKCCTLEELIEHYSEDADARLCCRLTTICPKIEAQAAVDPSTKFRDKWEIERGTLQLKRKLGDGRNGEVWEGVWNSTTPVAIKIPKPGPISNKLTFAEAQILKKLHDQNIIKLYAVCSLEKPVYVITELMKNGNLKDYLQNGEGRRLVLHHLIDIASQIASGMSYLEEHNYIHRDLCARNVLVGESNVVKIFNFGMAKINEYSLAEGEKVAVRWTAPEVFSLNHHNIKSDVWSFGIVLIELVTKGSLPYPDLKNAEMMERVQQGFRMPSPPGCPDPLYQIMMECWKQDPKERPTFEYLKTTLEDYYVG